MTVNHKQLGFSLLELLIAMMIVAILVGISYPLYSQHMVKARRHQAKIELLKMASRLEEYYSQNGSYQGANLKKLGINKFLNHKTYKLAIVKATNKHFLISATPLAEQAKQDARCGQLLLDDIGHRSVSGESKVNACW